METVYEGSQRSRVLNTIIKLGNPSLSQLSKELGISKAAVVKWIKKLENEGFIVKEYRQKKKGRPVCFIRYTDKILKDSIKECDNMAVETLKYIEENYGVEASMNAISSIYKKKTEKYRKYIIESSRKINKFLEIKREEGYKPELKSREDGIISIIEHNCPIIEISRRYAGTCEREKIMIRDLLEMDFEIIGTKVEGRPYCEFRSEKRRD
ncbi:helix-turn-helix transcriptional regulator [Caldiplasma sukawensis]